jgi:hypothetical protein
VSAFNAEFPVSDSRCLLGPRPGAELYAGAGVRGRTGPAVAGAVAGTAPGVGTGEKDLTGRRRKTLRASGRSCWLAWQDRPGGAGEAAGLRRK